MIAPDGKTIATIGDAPDQTVRIWDLGTGKEQRRWGGKDQVWSLAYSPDGKSLFAGGPDNTLVQWQCDTGKTIRRFAGHKGGVLATSLSPSGSILVSGGKDHRIFLWESTTGKQIRAIAGHDSPITALAYAHDGKLVASGAEDGTIRLWNPATGVTMRKLVDIPSSSPFAKIAAVLFSPDGKLLASIDCKDIISANEHQQLLRIWDVATGRELESISMPGGFARCIAFSPDGRSLAAGASDGSGYLWELATRKVRCRFTGHQHEVNSLTFTPDGMLLISASEDSTALVWDIIRGVPRTPPGGADDPTNAKSRWDSLASDNATTAYEVQCFLVLHPEAAMGLLQERLKPVQKVDQKQVDQLIGKLASSVFADRARAEKELAKLGEAVAPGLQKALLNSPTLEIRRRLENPLEATESWSGERLRKTRAVEILERIGGPEARRLLVRLGEGAPEAWLTSEAKATLQRLETSPRDTR